MSLSYLPDLIQSLSPAQVSSELQIPTATCLPSLDFSRHTNIQEVFEKHSHPLSVLPLGPVPLTPTSQSHVFCQFHVFNVLKPILYFCFHFFRTSLWHLCPGLSQQLFTWSLSFQVCSFRLFSTKLPRLMPLKCKSNYVSLLLKIL